MEDMHGEMTLFCDLLTVRMRVPHADAAVPSGACAVLRDATALRWVMHCRYCHAAQL